MDKVITHIVEEWFLTEPLLFSAWCTHTLTENTKMFVPMRTGKMRIEYNPEILKGWSQEKIKERLRFEVIRILLCHPYQRQPYKAKKSVLGIASDVTLTSTYHGSEAIHIPHGLQFDPGLCFEEYYAIVEEFLDQNLQSPPYDTEGLIDDGGGGVSDDADSVGAPTDDEWPKDNDGDTTQESPSESAQSQTGNPGSSRYEEKEEPLPQIVEDAAETAELWEEDQMATEQVKETIRRAQRCKQWGSLTGGLKDAIEASTIVRIDYRTILSSFRASVLCSERRRTRMIPSRRYGFQFMGSKRDFATQLLVAIDVSGSVSNKQVSQALSIINRFFKYGVENVDVIMFDVGLQGDVLSMKKAQKVIQIKGRGGTDFHAPIDFFLEHHYDGLIMITDGYAPVPSVPKSFYGNILWMIYNDNLYRSRTSQELDSDLCWIASFPKSKYTILPPV